MLDVERIRVYVSGYSDYVIRSRHAIFEVMHQIQLMPFAVKLPFSPIKEPIDTAFDAAANAHALICLVGQDLDSAPEDPIRNPNKISLEELEYKNAKQRHLPCLVIALLDSETGKILTPKSSAKTRTNVESLLKTAAQDVVYLRAFDSANVQASLAISLLKLRKKIQPQKYYFAAHSRDDIDRVSPFVSELKRSGIAVWYSISELEAGKDWELTIKSKLLGADGLLNFISFSNPGSNYISDQIASGQDHENLSVSVLLDPVPGFRIETDQQRVIDLSDKTAPQEFFTAARAFSTQLESDLAAQTQTVNITLAQAEQAATAIADELRPTSRAIDAKFGRPDSVFLVHGHDSELLREAEQFLRSINVTPVILRDQGGTNHSLLHKFNNSAQKTRFAIVLMGADDYGAATREYLETVGSDGIVAGDRALQYRSRQNVIFELGYFYGRLNWDRVFILRKNPPRYNPKFEMPSDIAGVASDVVDEAGTWKVNLLDTLAKAGFKVSTDFDT
jgi:predicted nucleotide-binding protein